MSLHNRTPAEINTLHHNLSYYFVYNPSKGAAIFFIIYFFIFSCLFLYRSIRYKHYWLIWLVLMCLLETSGYICRIDLIVYTNYTAFVGMLVIIILAPNLLAMSNYIAFGEKLMRLATIDNTTNNIQKLLVTKRWLLPIIFLITDIISIIIQGIGGSILATAASNGNTIQFNKGRTVMLAGLAIQMCFVILFMTIVLYAYKTMLNTIEIHKKINLSLLIIVITMILLIGRNAYRLAEFQIGNFTSGYVNENEAWYYIFETTLMSIDVLLLAIYDLTKLIPAECFNNKSNIDSSIDNSSSSKIDNENISDELAKFSDIVVTNKIDTADDTQTTDYIV